MLPVTIIQDQPSRNFAKTVGEGLGRSINKLPAPFCRPQPSLPKSSWKIYLMGRLKVYKRWSLKRWLSSFALWVKN